MISLFIREDEKKHPEIIPTLLLLVLTRASSFLHPTSSLSRICSGPQGIFSFWFMIIVVLLRLKKKEKKKKKRKLFDNRIWIN